MERRPFFRFVLVVLIISLGACGLVYDQAISDYHALSSSVRIGDSKERVLNILMPAQDALPFGLKRPPEAFNVDAPTGKSVVEIYYFRSMGIRGNWGATDDNFTPYVFRDGILVAIGWTALGGPKTRAQAPPPSPRPQTVVVPATPQAQPKTNFTCMQMGPFLNCH